MAKYKNPFPYFVGTLSLADLATKKNRVVVMNILGNESRKVTPVSHAFSGGNIVAGVQYGRPGKLKTPAGDIPVYSRLAEVVKNHEFDTGVVYLPPSAVFYAVTELCHYKSAGECDLKKIVIVTEKISVKDQRMIRAVCQANEVDVFGANSLGLADSWNHVRIGGALGGDNPEETLLKGSVAIHSNSGNFGNTIAEYLKTEGIGTSVILSSGKDTIIQFAAAEFLNAAQNDKRTKLALMYVEPGGFYEKQALDWIQEGRFKFNKPIIACVTGRWKSNLSRAVGHAGALAGSNDDAESKEKWFDDYFGVPAFDPEHPERVSKKGVRIESIQHAPLAAKALYDLLGMKPDFEPRGDLSLKAWMGNDFDWKLPPHLRLDIVEAIPPYNEQIAEAQKQLGANFLRRRMRNASGASRINIRTQVAELHGVPVIDLIDYPLESNMIFALTKMHPEESKLRLINISLNYLYPTSSLCKEVVQKAEANGATPNEALMSAVAILGNHADFRLAKKYTKALIDLFVELGITDVQHEIDYEQAAKLAKDFIPSGKRKADSFTHFFIDNIRTQFNASNIMHYAARFVEQNKLEDPNIFLISALLLSLSLPALVLKKISRETAEDLYTYLAIEAQMLNWMQSGKATKLLKEIQERSNLEALKSSFTEVAYHSVFGEAPKGKQLKEFAALIALTLTNGPGTISAKGAKESVSARNNISTAFAGFLSNTGLSHGGSGYEAVEFLLKSFEGIKLKDPEDTGATDLKKLATKVAIDYKKYKEDAKLRGASSYDRIPCINHPVFKGKRVNIDPREDFIYKRFRKEGIGNIFWEFYHDLVKQLYKKGVSSNVYCVNIDAVIAVISLKLMWKSYRSKRISDAEMQKIGFIIFLIGRMTGVSAEIADHRDRGQDMDCRTPQSELQFVV
jgi:succinyl-CoA synthetase alpha subunit/citrate synthase